MVRAPCCEKMGLKKGPWTPEEDQILTSYIQRYGHGNWRALPKQAGLLRCGKSCRLRWTNYLRPDIKRGNFTKEEEETIIKLHEMLGNRWSTIASRLPGRTDNEIKNVWHTHLKKRLKPNPAGITKLQDSMKMLESEGNDVFTRRSVQDMNNFPSQLPTTDNNSNNNSNSAYLSVSPQTTTSSSSDLSSATTDSSVLTADTCVKDEYFMDSSPEDLPEFGGNVWSEAVRMMDNFIVTEEFPSINIDPNLHESGSFFPVNGPCNSNMDDNLDFWFNLFLKSGELPDLELPQF